MSYSHSDPSPIVLPGLALVTLVYFALVVWTLIWTYRDANARGKSGCLVTLVVFLLSWPIGLLVWLIFRPDRMKKIRRARMIDQ